MYKGPRYIPTEPVYKEILVRAYQYDENCKVILDHRVIIVTWQNVRAILDAIRIRYNYTCVILDSIKLAEQNSESFNVYRCVVDHSGQQLVPIEIPN